jgi:Phytanoyl-CoA dioxygenase (PhyH)
VWIAIDCVTKENGPVYFVKGSHKVGVLPTKSSGVRGNSIGMTKPPRVPLSEQYCGRLSPGDATIHHGNTLELQCHYVNGSTGIPFWDYNRRATRCDKMGKLETLS